MLLPWPGWTVHGKHRASGGRDKKFALLVSHWPADLSDHYWKENGPGVAEAHATNVCERSGTSLPHPQLWILYLNFC